MEGETRLEQGADRSTREGAKTRPSMTRVRRSPEEARALYDRMSRWYDVLAGGSEEKHREAGLRRLQAEAGEHILEIGYGTGHALASLAEQVGSAGRAIGVDISEGMARVAQERLEEEGEPGGVGLICGDGARLPLRDGMADGVFMSFTLELFDTPRMGQVLDECKRVLREGGRLSVVSLARREDRPLAVRVYECVHERIPRYVDCRPIPVERVVVGAGFEIAEVERRSMWGLPVDVVLAQAMRDGGDGAASRSGK